MSRSQTLPWDPDFDSRCPIFAPLQSVAGPFRVHAARWPSLGDYQRALDAVEPQIASAAGKVIRIVPQAGRPRCFEQHYAPRIYFSGELQTRGENWHDFFQLLTWMIFPGTKATINARHIPMLKARLTKGADSGRRAPAENMLSLFDEGGAVILATDQSLLDLVRTFRWKELFWERRNELPNKFSCVTFGHAMYEKALSPYLGMTANCVLLHVDQELLRTTTETRLAWLDRELSQMFEDPERLRVPHDLAPFPILGMPGWDPGNVREVYYDNGHYFRSGRTQRDGCSGCA